MPTMIVAGSQYLNLQPLFGLLGANSPNCNAAALGIEPEIDYVVVGHHVVRALHADLASGPNLELRSCYSALLDAAFPALRNDLT